MPRRKGRGGDPVLYVAVKKRKRKKGRHDCGRFHFRRLLTEGKGEIRGEAITSLELLIERG